VDVSKLGPGQRIAAGAAVLLLIDLWLDWYNVGTDAFSVGINAWQSYSWTDLLLFITILVALAMAAQAIGLLSVPIKLSTVLLPLASVMALIVLFRLLINQPGPDNDLINNEFGGYLGFLLTAAVAYGALRAQGEHEAVSAPGTFRVGDHTATTASTTSEPAAPPPPPPAATTPPPAAPSSTTDDPPPPPPPAAG
jgi:hypothetical protein